MIKAAHDKGIWVMLDVVANHVAYIDTNYGLVSPFNQESHYHSKCQINNWNDQNEVEYCRLSNLPDLNQDNQYVRDTLKTWVKDTVQKFAFDGIRIDTVPHVKKPFWQEYAKSAGIFQIGEVLNGDIGLVSSYTHDALDSVMNYPLYFAMKNVFNYKQSMYQLRNTMNAEKPAFSDMDLLGLFVDNHDNPRFLSISYSMPLFKSALAFTLFAQGLPIIYYGTEQGFSGGADPANREALWPTGLSTEHPMYKFLTQLITIRKSHQVWAQPHIERWCDDTFYAFSRGDVLIALTNQQGTQHRDVTYHPYKAGQKVCNLMIAGDCVTISQDNKFGVTLVNGEVKIYYPATSSLEEFFLQE